MARKPKKLAGIDRRGENAWRIRYVKDRKRHSETVIGTQADAVARRDLIRADIARNTWTAPANIPVAEWAATWVEQYLKRSVATRSYERQQSIVNRQIVPALGAIPLQKRSTVRINEFYRNLESSGLGVATVRYAHIVLGSCLKAAVKIGALARNPVANASPPRGKSESGGRALTQAELDKLLKAFDGDQLFPVVALAAGTGARINELL